MRTPLPIFAESGRPRPAGFETGAFACSLLLALLFGAGCAKIGDPQPPEVRIPVPATDLSARQLADSVVLTVSKPERNTNGSEATTLRSVVVLRLAEAGDRSTPVPQDRFIHEAARILSIPDSRFPEYLTDGVFVIRDPLGPESAPANSKAFRYAVLFLNNKKQAAGLSNQVVIQPVPVPPAPEKLSGEVTQDSIQLTWRVPSENMDGSRPPRIAGYNVYRTENPLQLPPRPLNAEPVQAPGFADRNFQFDITYYYAVSTVASLQDPRAESFPSKAIPVESRDVFPPAPPLDFNALFQEGTVVLLWAPSPSADVAGYHLYRTEKGNTARPMVNSGLISGLSYRDTQLDPGKEYEYEITAVDTHGNEGPGTRVEVEKR